MTPNLNSQNAYEVLGIPPDAQMDVVRQAFKALALRYHPDAAPPEQKKDAAALFARINQAHSLLRDSQKRQQYNELLSRGLTPDLSKPIEDQGRVASLAEIVGEIESLGIDSRPVETLIPAGKLRDELLTPHLIQGENFRESVIDAVSVCGPMTCSGFSRPPGTMTGYIVVTELRLILLMTFEDRENLGTQNHPRIRTTWNYRSVSLPFAHLERVHILYEPEPEGPLLTPTDRIDISAGDTAFNLGFPIGPVRIERLMLVLNVQGLPLRMHSPPRKEVRWRKEALVMWLAAFLGSLPSLLIWALLFIVTAFMSCGGHTKPSGVRGDEWHYISMKLLAWMNAHYLSALLWYAALAGIAIAGFKVLKHVRETWSTPNPSQFFGDLQADYARGAPALVVPTAAPPGAAAPVRDAAVPNAKVSSQLALK